MSAALESSDLLPKVPRLPLSEVPEVSAYFKNTLRAMFGEDEDKVRSYVQEITQTPWTPERMRERLAGIEDGEALKSAMRRLRRDVMMNLVARDISGLANLEEVVTVMSDLAEIAIDRTVSVYAKELAKRFGVPRSETGVPQDLIVIGMGKLGGRELNVSSDIDLIFFYDRHRNIPLSARSSAIRSSTSGWQRRSSRPYLKLLGKASCSAWICVCARTETPVRSWVPATCSKST